MATSRLRRSKLRPARTSRQPLPGNQSNGCHRQKLPYARVATLLVLICLIAPVTGCSFKFLYNHLDFLIPAYIDGMVSLDDMLESRLERRALVLLNWHRKTQLPVYADWLRGVQHELNAGLREERVQQHFADIEQFWKVLSERINREIILLLPLINIAQQQEFFESLHNKNEDFREEFVDLDEEERLEHYTERLVDTYETWLGSINDEQMQWIKSAARRLQSGAGLRLERRLRWQHGIEAILSSTDDAGVRREKLRGFLADFNGIDNAALREILDSNKIVLARLTVRIAQVLTAGQREYYIAKTDDYVRTFDKLAKDRF